MFDIIALNIIFIITPILVYLLYIVYENIIGKRGNNLFFAFTILTSLYFIVKFSTYFNYSKDIIKLLLFIVMIKNKISLSIIITFLFIILNINNSLLLSISYIINLTLYFNFFKNTKLEYKLVLFILIDLVLSILFNYFSYYILFTNIVYLLVAYIFVLFMNKVEDIIDIYGTIRVVEYEKEFRDSLFKVTHEIKNPIAVCKGYLDMLDTSNSKQVNKYIPIIKQEIDRTLTLMNDYLNLTKISVDKSIIDISLLLDDVCGLVQSLLIGKNIHFIPNILDDEVYIEADYNRLKQVFINLIKNSVESIDGNKIGIIKLNMIKNKNLVITLEDNGKGMDKFTLNKVGEIFYTTKDKGSGLGVKLCYEIIELHNGKLKYSSKEGKGTIVKIILPLYKK